MKKLIKYLPFAALFILPLLFYPLVDASGWRSSSDVHAVLEFASSLLAITAGVMVLIHFISTGRWFFLIISIGFVLVGGEEFIHFLFSLSRIWTETHPTFKLAISATWLTGHFILAVSLFTALIFRDREVVPAKRVRKAVVYNIIGFLCATTVALLIFYFPLLPDFVQLGSVSKKIIELSLALSFFIAFILYFKNYIKQQSHAPLLWSIIACIIFRVLAHIFIFDAQAFYDAHWDSAHLFVFLSYFFPIFGVWGETIKTHRSVQLQIVELAKEVNTRKLLEEKIDETEKIFENIFDNAVEGVYQTTLEGKFISVNNAYAKMFGYKTPEEVISEVLDISHQLYVNPDDRKITTAILKEKGILKNYEMQMYKKDRSKIWVSVNARLRKSSRGNTFYEGFISDITDRKQLDIQLKEREALLNEVGAVAKIGGWEMDMETGNATWSKETYDIVEIDYNKPIPGFNEHVGYYLPEYREMIENKMKTLVETKQPIKFEAVLKTQKGNTKWCRALGEAIVKDGKLIKLRGTFQDITEEKQAEVEMHKMLEISEHSRNELLTILEDRNRVDETLLKSEKQYKMLFNEMINGFAVHEIILDDNKQPIDYRFLQVNAAFEQLTGLRAEAIIGKTVLEVMPKIESLFIERYGEVALTGKEVQFTSYSQELNKYFSISAYAPEPGKFATIFEDITERKQAENALRESDKRLRYAQQMAKIGNWELGIQTNRLIWSDETYRIFEIDPTQFGASYEAFLDAIHPDDRDVVDKTYAASVKNRTSYIVDHRLLMKSGKIKFVQEIGETIYDDQGAPVRSIGTIQDITERKQAEEALQKSEEEFRSLAESMPQIVWATRADGWNIYFNQQWMDYTGMTLEESYGHGWNKPFHPDDRQRAWDAWQNAVKNNGIYSIEARLRRFDGEYRWWLVRGVPLIDESGKIRKWFGTCTDIEELKQAERRLKTSEAKFRAVAELSPLAIYASTGSDQKAVYINEAFYKTFGFSKEDVPTVGHWWIKAFPDEKYRQQIFDEWTYRIEQAQKNNTDVEALECVCTCKDGSEKVIAWVGKTIGDEFWAYGYDFTERMQSEKALKESEERLRLSTELANIAVWEYSFITNSMSRSRNHDRLYGLDWQTKWDINTFLTATHPEDRKYSNDFIQRSVASGGSDDYKFDFRVIYPDKSIHWLMVNGRVVERDSNGQGIRVRGTLIDITESKRAEESIKISRERLLLATEGANLGVWNWNIVTGELIWSDQCKALFGVRLDETMSYQRFRDALHPDDRESTDRVVKDALENHKDYDIEYRSLWPDGSIHWLAARGRGYYDATDKPLRMEGIVLEITERKLAVEKLNEVRQYLENLINYANAPIIVWDVNFKITRFNKAFERLTGLDATLVIGQSLDILFPADRVSETMEFIKKTSLSLGQWEVVEIPIKNVNGSVRTVLWNSANILNTDGSTIVSTIAQGQDITERKEAEESIKSYTKRLNDLHRIDQAILQAVDSPEKITQEAVIHLRNLLHCQRVSVGLFDFENKEVRIFAANGKIGLMEQIGRDLPEGIYGDVDILRQNKLEIVEDSSKMAAVPNLIKTLQVEDIRSFINAPIFSFNELIGVLNIGWDTPRIISPEEQEMANEVASQISIAIEHARLLLETKRHADELEEIVLKRTAQLEASNKELEAFSYSVSHDLRAPLRHISGYVDLLTDRFPDSFPEKAKHYLMTIAHSVRQMGALIDDLLQFSRTGRKEMQKANLDMNIVLQETISSIKNESADRNIEWIIAELPRVSGDSSLLKQVWLNLLSNAVKFTRPKEKAIIKVGFQKENEEFVFFVRDNGVGFDMQYANKLFGVFQRLHSIEEFEGTGIGLAIVQRIILKHGGRTWAESELGKGATFYFTLSDKKEEDV